MSKCSAGQGGSLPTLRSAGGARTAGMALPVRIAAALAGFIILFLQPACLFRKHKAVVPQAPPASVRIAYLPLNVSSDNADLRLLSLAVPVMMAKVSESAPDLDAVPLWEVMPIAVEAAGNSRTITVEVAAYIASRLSAKWATEGELAPTKDGAQMTVDFIPVKTTLVPFRYEKTVGIDSLVGHFEDAFAQFLRYLVVRPMTKDDTHPLTSKSLKEIAGALDREYGWFATADPGKSNKIVADLARSDNRLARLLFNPNLYPGLSTPSPARKTGKPAASRGIEKENATPAPTPPKPQAPPPKEPGSSDAGQPRTRDAQAAAPESPKQSPANFESTGSPRSETPLPPPTSVASFVPPPPRTFSQKLESAAPVAGLIQNNPPAKRPSSTTLQGIASESPPRASTESGRSRTGGSDKLVPLAMNKASPGPQRSGFKIQVGSSRSKEEADVVVGRLARAGLAAEVAKVDLKEKGIWYRIRLQGYNSRRIAEDAGKKLMESKLISQYWVVPQD